MLHHKMRIRGMRKRSLEDQNSTYQLDFHSIETMNHIFFQLSDLFFYLILANNRNGLKIKGHKR